MNQWDRYFPHRGDWESILPNPVQVKEAVLSGNGKDAYFALALSDGTRIEMSAADVTIHADGPMTVQINRLDDLNLEIRYSGSGLLARSARVRFDGYDWQEEFRSDVHEWLSNGGRGELGYAVGIEITLAAQE